MGSKQCNAFACSGMKKGRQQRDDATHGFARRRQAHDIPLFQLYSFFTSTCPLGLNGPFSEKAPTPSDEHPGPTEPRNLRKSKNGRVDDKNLDQGFHFKQDRENKKNARPGSAMHPGFIQSELRTERTAIEPEDERLGGGVDVGLHEVVEQGPLAAVVHADVAGVLAEAHLRLPGEPPDPVRGGGSPVARTRTAQRGRDEHQHQRQ